MDWKLIIYIIADFVLPVTVFGFMYLAFRILRKHVSSLHELCLKMQKEIAHLYLMVDVLATGVPPYASRFYRRIREAGPECDMEDLGKQESMNSFRQARERIREAVECEEDPQRKEVLETAANELEGVYNLWSTLDKDSSEEYKESVMKNISESMKKIARLNEE